jgi:hypothetical protein
MRYEWKEAGKRGRRKNRWKHVREGRKIKGKWQNEKNRIEGEMEESMYTRMVRWKETGKGR